MDSSIIQGPFSVAPCQTKVSRFATFSSPPPPQAAHALGAVLGPELRRQWKELEVTVKGLCTPEQRQGLWLRMELKVWFAAKQD